PFDHRRQAVRLAGARHLLRPVLGLARACERVGERGRVSLHLQRPAGDAIARPLSRGSVRRQWRAAAAPRRTRAEATMRLVTHRSTVESAARLGAVDDDMVVDVEKIGATAGLALPSTMLDFIDLGPVALAGLRDALDEHRARWPAGVAIPLSNVKLLAPIPRP